MLIVKYNSVCIQQMGFLIAMNNFDNKITSWKSSQISWFGFLFSKSCKSQSFFLNSAFDQIFKKYLKKSTFGYFSTYEIYHIHFSTK